MKIGEVAQRVGVSISALRMYEQRGLIAADRSSRGTRQYGEEDVARFQAIVGLTRAEVPIETVARLARIRLANATGNAAGREVQTVLNEMEAAMAARLAVLQAALDDLRQAQGRLAGCQGCSRLPTRENCSDCTVADSLLACPVMRVVWDQASSDG